MGTIRLGSATSPIVANTDVRASRSGMLAPTSEPKTTRRMISVSGMERSPAFASCEANSSSSAFPVDADPAWPT